MTKKEVNIIPKIKLGKQQKIVKNIPELIYRNMIIKYADTVRTEEDTDREWSSVFLEEIDTQYSKQFSGFKLLSMIEFGLDNRKFKAKKVLEGTEDKIIKDGIFSLTKNINFNYPIEEEQSKKLFDILLEYIFRTKFDNNETVVVDSYTKSLLKNFTSEFQNRDLVKGTQLEEMAFEAYPSILFAVNPDFLIAIAIKPNNVHFIDNKVQDIDKVFSISFAVYKNPKPNVSLKYEELSNYFNSFSMFLYKEKLDANIKDSMGEAADIARYWYTDGLRKLNNKQDIFDKSVDSFTFSEAFIREILVANIEGVNNIEVYPFDRCFIFKDSALLEKKKDNTGNYMYPESSNIVVSEAKLLQKSISDESVIKKRGNFLYEWERYYKDIKDYDIDFSNKEIEFESFEIKKTDGENQELVSGDYKSIIEYSENEGLKDFKHDDEKAIDFMLYNLLTQKAEPKDILDLEKKYFNNNDGLCYIYGNGVNLNNMPLLKSFQEAYWKNISQLKENDIPNGFVFNDFIKNVDIENTKVVFISYDPTRAKSGKNIEIDSKHAFSILIIANWDVPKTISEIGAEKEDLNTALKLIVRQKTESAELIKHEREKQKKFISNQLRQAIHAIKGSVSDSDVKERIDEVYQDFKKKLEDDQQELKEHEISNECKNKRIESLFTKLIDRNSFKVDTPIELWDIAAKEILTLGFGTKNIKIKKDQIAFNLQESFIPDFKIKLDQITIQETFHVMLKNAIEAAVDSQEKSLTVSVNINYLDETKGLLNICFINDTKPIAQERLINMNTAIDDIEPNVEKEGSTGSGVASSRSQLQSRFGTDANIKFMLLTPTKIKSILSLPVEIIHNQNYYKIKTEKIEKVNIRDIFYLEDEEVFYKPSIEFLSKHNLECKHSVSKDDFNDYWKNAKILFTDINVYNKGQKKRAGIQAVKEFHEANKNGTVFILTSESPSDLLTAFNKINKDIIHFGKINSIETGNIYILPQKTIEDACKKHKNILTFIQRNEENSEENVESVSYEITKLSKLNLSKNFENIEKLYQYKTIEQHQFEKVYDEWTSKEYFHPVEEMEDSISNPDIFSNLLVVPVIINNPNSINYSRIVLFGLKNNMLIIPQTESSEVNLDDIYSLLLEKEYIDLRSIGIFSSMNHDLSHVSGEEVSRLTQEIASLDIYHDGKSLNALNVFESSNDEIEKINRLDINFNSFLEKNQHLEEDFVGLRKSLKYFINTHKFIQGAIQ